VPSLFDANQPAKIARITNSLRPWSAIEALSTHDATAQTKPPLALAFSFPRTT
ncbi:unnamed protein product, partial [Acidithrix sp. C25]